MHTIRLLEVYKSDRASSKKTNLEIKVSIFLETGQCNRRQTKENKVLTIEILVHLL